MNAQSETLKDIVGRLSAMVGGSDKANGNWSRWRSAATRHALTAQQGAGVSGAGLSALRAAVAHKPNRHAEAVAAVAKAGKNALPLDAAFKEFLKVWAFHAS